MTYNPGKECGTCENCKLRRIPCDIKIREDIYVDFIYDVYCKIDDKSLSGVHSTKAELCKYYKEQL